MHVLKVRATIWNIYYELGNESFAQVLIRLFLNQSHKGKLIAFEIWPTRVWYFWLGMTPEISILKFRSFTICWCINDKKRACCDWEEWSVNHRNKFLIFICPCIVNIIPNYNQQDAKFIYLFISTDAPHVSGGFSAHHQEHINVHAASSTLVASSSIGWHYLKLHVQLMCSWWWAEEPPEMCRASVERNK